MSQNFFQIIRPVHVHLKTDKVDLKKRPPWKNFFLHFFSINSSSRHEKCCQMLQRLFWLFQCSKNPQWLVTLVKFYSLLFFSPHLQTNQTFSLEWPWFDVLLMSLAFVLVDLENAKVPILWQMQSLGQVQNDTFWQVFVWSFNFLCSILHDDFWIKH